MVDFLGCIAAGILGGTFAFVVKEIYLREKPLFPYSRVYTIDITLRNNNEDLLDFIDRAKREKLGKYKWVSSNIKGIKDKIIV